MYSAVVLAGAGRPQGILTDFSYKRLLGHHFISEYKHTLRLTIRGSTKTILEHTVSALRKSSSIDDIVIVGEIAKLQHIDFGLKTKLLQANESIVHNSALGYEKASKNDSDKCIFVCGDLPYITADDVTRFVEDAAEICDYTDIVFGLTTKRSIRINARLERIRGRPFLPVLQDVRFGTRPANHRVMKLRYGNVFFGKPTKGIEQLEEIYDHGRKFLSPSTIAFLLTNYPGLTWKATLGLLRISPLSGAYVQRTMHEKTGVRIQFAPAPPNFEKDIDSYRDIKSSALAEKAERRARLPSNKAINYLTR